MKINIYGSWLSARVAAACLAKVGNDVVICEMSQYKEQALKRIPITRDEPGLLRALKVEADCGRLSRCGYELLPAAEIHWLALASTEQKTAEQVVRDLHVAEQVFQGVQVNVHDPEALGNLKKSYADEDLIVCHETHMSAAKGVGALLLATEWPLYWSPDCQQLGDIMRQPLVIDGRNVFDKDVMRANGFIYLGVGRS